MKSLPMKIKAPPMLETNAYLSALDQTKERASLAATQKLEPFNAI